MNVDRESNEPKPEARVPAVSIIIPSWDGHRNGCVSRLLESIEWQTFRDYEIHIVKGISPQGRAINQGADQARGELLVIIDDDSRLADETVIQRLVDAMRQDDRIGMAGASIVAMPEANAFQKRAGKQFPRFNTPVVETITDSDLACHGCCAIPKGVFETIGREREDIIRGLDPDLRVRMRNAGYRVTLVPHARIYHPLPENWERLVRTFFRNGFGSAYAYKFQPDSVYETHEKLHEASFRPKTSLVFRVARFPVRLLAALFSAQFIRLGAYAAYACGYVWGLCTAKEKAIDAGA